jgi:hypothetical protein
MKKRQQIFYRLQCPSNSTKFAIDEKGEKVRKRLSLFACQRDCDSVPKFEIWLLFLACLPVSEKTANHEMLVNIFLKV